MQIRSPPPLPNYFSSLHLFLDLTPYQRLTPIELIHCKLFNPRRTNFNGVTLLRTNHVRVDSKRYPWITVPQFLLHHSGVALSASFANSAAMCSVTRTCAVCP